MASATSEESPPHEHANEQKLAEVVDVVRLIMELLLPNSTKTLVETMLCSRDFYSIGATVLYKDLDTSRNWRVQRFLIANFGSQKPPSARLREYVRTVKCLNVDVVASLFRHSEIRDLSFKVISKEEDKQFWKLLRGAPSSLRKLKVEWVGSAAFSTLIERPLPSSLERVEYVYTEVDKPPRSPLLQLAALSDDRFTATPDLVKGLAALPNLKEWFLETPDRPTDIDLIFKNHPNLVSTCKGLKLAEKCLVGLLRQYGSDFRPTKLDVDLVQLGVDRDLVEFDDSWVNLELPETVREITVRCNFSEDASTLFSRIARLPELEKVVLSTAANFPATALLAKFPSIASKVKHVTRNPN